MIYPLGYFTQQELFEKSKAFYKGKKITIQSNGNQYRRYKMIYKWVTETITIVEVKNVYKKYSEKSEGFYDLTVFYTTDFFNDDSEHVYQMHILDFINLINQSNITTTTD